MLILWVQFRSLIYLTPGYTNAQRNAITRVVVVTVCLILLGSLFLGELLLSFFGITINSFRVAGGILLMLMAISMLHAKTSGTQQTEEAKVSEEKNSVAVVPLAMPLLAGPGAISTVILYAHKGSGANHHFMVGGTILIMCVVLYLTFRFVPFISRYITQTGIDVSTRIMGLILAAIAVEFMANGLKGLFPVLASRF